MSVEQRLRRLGEIARPYSRPFRATENTAYFIDCTFAFRAFDSYGTGIRVAFAADRQLLPILRKHARRDWNKQHGEGIGLLVLLFTPFEREVYLGDRYKFSFRKDLNFFVLQSANPINFEPVSRSTNLETFVAQKNLV